MKKFFTGKYGIRNRILVVNCLVCICIFTRLLTNMYVIAGYDLLLLILLFYFMRKAKRAERFYFDLYLLAEEWGNRHFLEIMEDRMLNPYHWFISKAPSITELMHSRKKYKLENWFDEEIIERITN